MLLCGAGDSLKGGPGTQQALGEQTVVAVSKDKRLRCVEAAEALSSPLHPPTRTSSRLGHWLAGGRQGQDRRVRCAPALVPAPRARSRLPRPAGLRQADTSEESRAGAGFQVPRSAFAVALREDPKVGALSARPLSSGLPGVAAPHCCRQPWSLRLSPGRHGPLCRSVPETAASAGPTQTRQGQGAHPGRGPGGPGARAGCLPCPGSWCFEACRLGHPAWPAPLPVAPASPRKSLTIARPLLPSRPHLSAPAGAAPAPARCPSPPIPASLSSSSPAPALRAAFGGHAFSSRGPRLLGRDLRVHLGEPMPV